MVSYSLAMDGPVRRNCSTFRTKLLLCWPSWSHQFGKIYPAEHHHFPVQCHLPTMSQTGSCLGPPGHWQIMPGSLHSLAGCSSSVIIASVFDRAITGSLWGI